MTVAERTLPHWDMTVVYPSLASAEFADGFRAVVRSIDDLMVLFAYHQIGQRASAPLDDATIHAFETVSAHYNAVLEGLMTCGAYINSFVSTDSRDELAQAKQSELRQQNVRAVTLGTRFTAWIGSLDVEGLIQCSADARDHAYMLRKAKAQAAHLMSPAEEALAAELSVTGGGAWARLYNTFTSQLLVPLELDGQTREWPMSTLRNFAFGANREVRQRAYEAELAAWQRAAVPIASALNNIKGEMNTLSARRQWDSPLDVALFVNNIDRATLDAMMQAARESFPDFRRYLRAKARALGLPALA